MRIKLTSVYVDDQDKALKFYTEVLGFVKKRDIPVGEFRFLTVVSPEEPDGTELLLEPSENPATQAFKKAVFEQGIPLAMTGSIARITPPCLPGQFGDCLERLQIKAVKQYYIFNCGVSIMGSPYQGPSTLKATI